MSIQESIKSLEFDIGLCLYVDIFQFVENDGKVETVRSREDFFISESNFQMLNSCSSFEEQQNFLRELLLQNDYHHNDICHLQICYDNLEHWNTKNTLSFQDKTFHHDVETNDSHEKWRVNANYIFCISRT